MTQLQNQSQKNPQRNKEDTPKPFLAHVQELKGRILVYVFFLLFFSGIGFYLKDAVLHFLVDPLQQPLYYNSPAGGITFVLTLSFFFGFVFSIPVLLLQVFLFIDPVLPKRITYAIWLTVASSTVLLVLGIAFAYFVSIPAVLVFLKNFTSGDIQGLITTTEYISFLVTYLGGFGLLFQLPLIILFINSLTPLSSKKLLSFEKWVVLVSFVFSAIITATPDIINQLAIAVPMILLYQVSIFLVWVANKAKRL